MFIEYHKNNARDGNSEDGSKEEIQMVECERVLDASLFNSTWIPLTFTHCLMNNNTSTNNNLCMKV